MLPPAAGASYARTAKEGREPLSRVPFFLVPHFCLSPPPLPIHPCTFIPTSSLTAALSSLAYLRALLAPFLLRSHVPHHFSTFLFLLFFYFFFGFVLLSFVFLFFVFGKSKGLVFSTLRISPQPLRSKRRRE